MLSLLWYTLNPTLASRRAALPRKASSSASLMALSKLAIGRKWGTASASPALMAMTAASRVGDLAARGGAPTREARSPLPAPASEAASGEAAKAVAKAGQRATRSRSLRSKASKAKSLSASVCLPKRKATRGSMRASMTGRWMGRGAVGRD